MRHPTHRLRAFTLIEITLVLAILIGLAAMGSLTATQYWHYRDARDAGDSLRAVKNAQRLYLADHPLDSVANLTQADLLPYMPNSVWPVLPSTVDGSAVPTISFNVFPPVATVGGTTYDPTPSTTDGLWDSGK